MKFAMCNEFCEGWAFEDVCRLAADAGYDGVEIAPFTLAPTVYQIAPDQPNELRETAMDHGLTIVGLHWLLARTEGLHVNSDDDEVREATVEYLRAEVDLCSELGGHVMIFGSPQQRNIAPEQEKEVVWERAVKTMRELGRYAADRDVTICMEPLGSDETNFLASAAEARRFVQDVDHPGLKMMLDVKAMVHGEDEEPIPQIIRDCAGYFAHFHANDANRNGPGFGDTEYAPIVEALREVGYDRWVSVEVFDFSLGAERIARESRSYLTEKFGPIS
jgi:sugar phosphate isomerase/epimerase